MSIFGVLFVGCTPAWCFFLVRIFCLFSLSFFSFFSIFGLVVCLPPLGKDTTLISSIIRGATFHGELVGVSGFLFLQFRMGAIFLFSAFGGCCPSWAMIRCTVNPVLFKKREAPNPQTLGYAREALSGA